LRYSSLSPDELVKACAGSRDAALWQEFIRRFQPVIAAAVLRRARQWGEPSRQTLDDLVQETYLKLCDNNSTLLRSFESRHPDSIFGFLKVVSANIVNDHFKAELAEKRGGGQTDAFDDASTVLSFPNTSNSMEQRVLLKEIDHLLASIETGADAHRNCTVFWLYYRAGLSASAIASLPSIRLGVKGVESLVHRMTRNLRVLVEKRDLTTHGEGKEGFQRSKSL
jgi:RNA polymerase sigma-70 factor (ECF subfamily)